MKFRMPYALVSLLLLLAPSMTFAQTTTDGGDNEENYPELDEFVAVEKLPEFDMQELQANIVYPAEARQQKIEGMVVLRVLIDKSGTVARSIVIKSDNSLLDQAAIGAVERTAFTPGIMNKQPVSLWTMVPVKFVLPETD